MDSQAAVLTHYKVQCHNIHLHHTPCIRLIQPNLDALLHAFRQIHANQLSNHTCLIDVGMLSQYDLPESIHVYHFQLVHNESKPVMNTFGQLVSRVFNNKKKHRELEPDLQLMIEITRVFNDCLKNPDINHIYFCCSEHNFPVIASCLIFWDSAGAKGSASDIYESAEYIQQTNTATRAKKFFKRLSTIGSRVDKLSTNSKRLLRDYTSVLQKCDYNICSIAKNLDCFLRSVSVEGISRMNLDLGQNRGVRLMLVLLKGNEFVYSSLQNHSTATAVSWSRGKDKVVMRPSSQNPVKLAGTLTLKVYHLPEFMEVDNPRKLLFEAHLDIALLSSILLDQDEWFAIIDTDDLIFENSNINPSELSNIRLRIEFAESLNDDPDFLMEEEKSDYGIMNPLQIEDSEVQLSQEQILAADEALARRLQYEWNEEGNLEAPRRMLSFAGSDEEKQRNVELFRHVFGLISGPNMEQFIYHQGASVEEIHSLPEILCESSSKFCGEMCMICREEFVEGDVLRMLPCVHVYHQGCVDMWLHCNDVCPVCQTSISHQGDY